MKRGLFEPYDFNGVKVKNRFMRSAVWMNMADRSGHFTEALYGIYEALARGGVGVVNVEVTGIVREEQCLPGQTTLCSDEFLPDFERLAGIMHQYGCKTFVQLGYGGTRTDYRVGERVILAPSDIPEISTGTKGTPMTVSDIHYLTESYAKAAGRVKKAGFDGVQLHCAHNYMMNQFLSPYYNNRTDAYGGSTENRMRFLAEVYQAIREEVGDSYPVSIKMTASDFMSGGIFVSGTGEVVELDDLSMTGLTFEESLKICKKLEELGFHSIELSGNCHSAARKLVGRVLDGYEIKEHGYFSEYARVLADEVHIPVITVGGLDSLAYIEELYEKTNIAMFSFARPFLCEPDFLEKWRQGISSTTTCVHCAMCRKDKEVNYCTAFREKPAVAGR